MFRVWRRPMCVQHVTPSSTCTIEPTCFLCRVRPFTVASAQIQTSFLQLSQVANISGPGKDANGQFCFEPVSSLNEFKVFLHFEQASVDMGCDEQSRKGCLAPTGLRIASDWPRIRIDCEKGSRTCPQIQITTTHG